MRLFLCTFAPMLAAAVLAVVGGERLSRREDVQRTPHDRNRLLDFSTALQLEIQRLESLYLSRLNRTVLAAGKEQEEQIKSTASETIGISLVQIFRVPKKDQTIRVLSPEQDEPEILMKGRKRAFNPRRASYLSDDIFSTKIFTKGVWLKTHNEKYRVYYERPDPDQVIAFLIDFQVVTTAFRDELENWIKGPSLPILEAEERVGVYYQSETLLSSGSDKSGPSAAIIPYRTIFGDLEIRAWDGITTSSYRDPLTLISTAALALLLFASGVILYLHQRRALRLASERVSFVNRVSHELGSPLTNLALNIDLANESLSKNPSETRKRLAIVIDEIERLSRLVANVLTFSRQEKDTLTLHEEHVLANNVVEEIISSYRPSFERRKMMITAKITTTQPCLLDPDAFRQIIGNLLSNVEKYAMSGKECQVSLLEKGEQLIVEVSDNGPGIPRKEKDRIFQPFERVHRTTSEGSSGTGLGLSIARDLASRMEGTLELIDSDTGCTFCLTLPVRPAFEVITTDPDAA